MWLYYIIQDYIIQDGMGHKKVPVSVNNDRATEILNSISVPISFYIFPLFFLLRGQNYFTHVEQ